ncbi:MULTISPECIES: M15 family metallopeptidase [Proteus]|mgnify:CR=1 FL=1|uniref:M15 family metallopeptidase n=3 Tax=Proteus TaxID=583 RepID=A0A6I7DB27_9GAMM|nr:MULTISPECIES: M15 family metallopeptidase [Proteus]MBG2802435.1 M15 family metallopeptidase [Proteus mirabilis]MBG3019124.1 M15 family metallopeptidase [Proteus mirabilis]MBG3151102.1 M15 family metallopeptidase [Proteus mirabilis]MBG6027846.1 M15 family metallopeptidase [Proteus mirabilis]MBG6047262.1 M15 family metallopeptidase [Proteus mirabilis]
MNTYTLSQRSQNNLNDVHQDLVRIVYLALTFSEYDFVVIEGVRSLIRQKELMKEGKSKTLNSRHLTGHAVDIVPLVNGVIPWQDWSAFESVSKAMKKAAYQLGISINWGGDWVSFRDGPHYELCRGAYP